MDTAVSLTAVIKIQRNADSEHVVCTMSDSDVIGAIAAHTGLADG